MAKVANEGPEIGGSQRINESNLLNHATSNNQELNPIAKGDNTAGAKSEPVASDALDNGVDHSARKCQYA